MAQVTKQRNFLFERLQIRRDLSNISYKLHNVWHRSYMHGFNGYYLSGVQIEALIHLAVFSLFNQFATSPCDVPTSPRSRRVTFSHFIGKTNWLRNLQQSFCIYWCEVTNQREQRYLVAACAFLRDVRALLVALLQISVRWFHNPSQCI